MRWPVACSALGLVVACAGREQPPPFAAGGGELPGLVTHVAAVRGLDGSRAPEIRFYGPREFSRLILARQRRAAAAEAPSGQAVFDELFGGTPPGPPSAPVRSDQVLREQVVAFYDEDEHRIHVRRRDPSDPEAEQEVLWAVVHEIGHALQYTNLPVPDLEQIEDEDAWLAALALIEGDAMATLLAYLADEARTPASRAFAQLRQRIRSGQFERAMELSGSASVLGRAPAVVRERLIFPYAAGASFVAAIHRAGGFALVNRVFEHPPRSTEQVLHPEKYLAGELPIGVSAPAAPVGHRLLGRSRMGELLVRVVFSECLPRPVAQAAAAGWGGDAYALLATPGGRPAFLWSTVWDTEGDAVEFEGALRSMAACSVRWRDVAALTIRRGARVVVARGLGAEAFGRASAAVLATSVSPRPSSPPLGAISIPPLRRSLPFRPPFLAEGRYFDERTGLSLPVPRGYVPRLEQGVFVVVREGPTPASGSVMISEWLVTQGNLGALYDEFAAAFRRGAEGEVELELLDTADLRLPVGVAVARTWRIDRGSGRLRLIVLPLCGRTGSVVFSQLWMDASGRRELDAWLGGIRPLAATPPPICAELDP